MNYFQKALADPINFYKEPKEVLEDGSLTKEETLRIFQQWEYDARELMVAEEKSMIAESSSFMLNRVLEGRSIN